MELVDIVTTPERRAAYRDAGFWNEDRLPSRVEMFAAHNPEKIAIVDFDGRRAKTYRELAADTNRVASLMLSEGISTGDVVTVQLPNWFETVVIDLAVIKVGAVLNPVLPLYRPHELATIFETGRPTFVFSPAKYRSFDYKQMIAGLRACTPSLRNHIAVPDPETDWLASYAAAPLEVHVSASAVSELIFTSGTEARPKAIMHTEETTNFAARAGGSALGLRDDDVVWMPSPIGHSTGLNYGVRVALYHGLTLVLQDTWSASVAASLIRRFRCTYTVAATTFLGDLLRYARDHPVDMSSMRLFNSGGAPVPADLVIAAEEHGFNVLRLYGSTEVLVATWNRPDSPRDKKIHTDGRVLDDLEVEVRDDQGRAVLGRPGEVFVRGPSTSVGFLGDPERTASTFDAQGWVRSGDIGALDADKYLTIVGRKKEIIIRGGLNIAPREIEDLILRHEAVAAVAVVGVPDERLGEIACACVVLLEGRRLVLEDLLTHLRSEGLATFKLPELMTVVPSLPRTPTGKVQKFQLIEAILAERARA